MSFDIEQEERSVLGDLMKLVKLIIILFLLVPFLSTAQDTANEKKYERGRFGCTDETERLYQNNPQDLDLQYLHYSCEVIKGDDSFLSKIDILAYHHSHLLANDFLANYYQTDGALDDSFIPVKTLDKAISYRMRTQVIIGLIPNYPYSTPYKVTEIKDQIELDSAYKLPHMYFYKYNLGIIGDYAVNLINSPSYEGDRDLETYPEYNNSMYDSLENVVKYAGECTNLPLKKHFKYDLDRYNATIKACDLMREMALNITPLEAKRKSLLSQCPDLNEENCPEYDKIHDEIDALLIGYMDRIILMNFW